MRIRDTIKGLAFVGMVAGAALAWTPGQLAAEDGERSSSRRGGDRVDFTAKRNLRVAIQYMENGDEERAVGAIENILERFPESYVRFEANLTLGRYYLERKANAKTALEYLARVEDIRDTVDEGEELRGESLDIYLESVYLTGVSWFELRQFPKCFSELRQITNKYPNTVWSNQAYYYIGMAHFLQKNWGKAIRYLSLVGTYIDPEADTAKYVEAGQRLYIKVTDGDLPILQKLDQLREKGRISVETRSGDKIELPLHPLSLRENLFIATVSTEVGEPVADDRTLQVIGGDEISVSYVDANTTSGESNVNRFASVQVVSSGTVGFTDATHEGKAKAAYTGQAIDVLLVDVDHDLSAEQEKMSVKVQVRYPVERKKVETVDHIEIREGALEEGPQWEIRDEIEIELAELSNREVDEIIEHKEGEIAREGLKLPGEEGQVPDEAPAGEGTGRDTWHTGRFAGRVNLVAMSESNKPDIDDRVLTCRPQDQLYVRYIDEAHVEGDVKRVVEDKVEVVGAWKEPLGSTGSRGSNEFIQSKKNLVEAENLLSLAEVFKEMGLMKGAKQNVQEGLNRADEVLKMPDIGDDLKQRAFQLRWQLYMTIDDHANAIATMQLFGEEYPDSRLADEALLGIGEVFIKQEAFAKARDVFQRILRLPESDAKPKAQFLLAKSMEEEAGQLEAAIPAYQAVADNFPDSQYTGDALAKLVKYHIDAGDFVSASNLLTIIFEEHPDKSWLDAMLVRWIVLAYRMGDFDLAYQKAQQLIMEYPDSEYAPKVRKMMERIQKKRDAAERRRREEAGQ